MTSIPMVRVIVLNWNGRFWLGGCLEALRQQDCPPFEIVLVDNGSTDGSADFVRQRFPECRVVALGANIGFAAGNNAGARGATVPYLAFLNNDTKVDPGWLAALVAAALHPSARRVDEFDSPEACGCRDTMWRLRRCCTALIFRERRGSASG